MKDKTNRNTVIVIGCVVILSVFLMVICFNVALIMVYPPSSQYQVDEIIGKTREEIIEKYGEPFAEYSDEDGNEMHYALSSLQEISRFWYYTEATAMYPVVICFDENGIAIRVYETKAEAYW